MAVLYTCEFRFLSYDVYKLLNLIMSCLTTMSGNMCRAYFVILIPLYCIYYYFMAQQYIVICIICYISSQGLAIHTYLSYLKNPNANFLQFIDIIWFFLLYTTKNQNVWLNLKYKQIISCIHSRDPLQLNIIYVYDRWTALAKTINIL